MPLLRLTQPAAEPIDLVTAKQHLRVDADLTGDDTLILAYITAAREYAEHEAGRTFVSSQWQLVMDAFPGGVGGLIPSGVMTTPWSLPAQAVQLERGPLISVGSITYTAMDGTTATMPPADYAVDLTGPIPRITPGFGKVWPIPLPQIGAVRITYTAGYGTTAAEVPACVKAWMLTRIASLYEHRGEVMAERGITVQPLPWVDRLLDPIRVVW